MELKDFRAAVAKFRNFTLKGCVRYLRLMVSGKEVRVVGECSKCGYCCQRISIEVQGGWIRKEEEFKSVVRRQPEYRRFSIAGHDSGGFLVFSCSWHLPEGICRDYGNRLGICREFPHPSLYFSSGSMPESCSYRFKVIRPFETVLRNEIDGK